MKPRERRGDGWQKGGERIEASPEAKALGVIVVVLSMAWQASGQAVSGGPRTDAESDVIPRRRVLAVSCRMRVAFTRASPPRVLAVRIFCRFFSAAVDATLTHTPVLVEPAIAALTAGADAGDHFFVDGTAGTGGHAHALLSALPKAQVLCIDRDHEAMEACRARLAPFGERARFFVGSFSDLPVALAAAAFPARVGGVLVDLGVGSHQLDASGRGFSFRSDAPLDMRFATASSAQTAGEVLSTWSERQLEELFRVYGGEPYALPIARAIVSWRGSGHRRRKIKSTLELRYVIEDALDAIGAPRGSDADQALPTGGSDGADDAPTTPEPSRERGWRPSVAALASAGVRRPTPAGAPPARKSIGYRAVDKLGTWPSAKAREKCLLRVSQRRPAYTRPLARVFQALRITVNDELAHLSSLLRSVPSVLAPGGGRLVALCYQPLEDAAVKAASTVLCAVCSSQAPTAGGLGTCECGTGAAFRVVTPVDGVRPSFDEVKANSRARLARMHVIERKCSVLPAADTPAGPGPASLDDALLSQHGAWDTALQESLRIALEPVLPPLSVRARPRHSRGPVDGSQSASALEVAAVSDDDELDDFSSDRDAASALGTEGPTQSKQLMRHSRSAGPASTSSGLSSSPRSRLQSPRSSSSRFPLDSAGPIRRRSEGAKQRRPEASVPSSRRSTTPGRTQQLSSPGPSVDPQSSRHLDRRGSADLPPSRSGAAAGSRPRRGSPTGAPSRRPPAPAVALNDDGMTRIRFK